METLKSAVGIGGKDQEGQEPVSGQEGTGTVAQPFDAGNDVGANPANSTEPAAATTTTGEEQSTTEAIVDKGKKAAATGGGWFNLNPFSKTDNTEPGTTSTTAPPGMADPTVNESSVPQTTTTAPVMSENTVPQTTTTAPPAPQNNGKQPAMNFPPSSDWANQARDGPRMSSLKSSRAYSVSSPAADKSRRDPIKADNPSRIPSAGGVALGSRAAEDRERRRSMMPTSSSDMPKLDKAGSPDAETQNNTMANTVPATATPVDNGEGSSKMAGGVDAPVDTPVEPNVPATATYGGESVEKEVAANGAATNPVTATNPAAPTVPATASNPADAAVVKSNPPPPVTSSEAGKKADAAALAASPDTKHERRASKLDGLKKFLGRNK